MTNASDANLTPIPRPAQNRCFGCGLANQNGMHLEFYAASDGSVVAQPTVAECFESGMGFLHGGIIATLLDEAMSKAMHANNVLAMTRHIEVDYLRPVPSLKPIRIEARRTHHEGKKQYVQAHILSPDGETLATAKGLFIEIKRQE
jgi:uncharacterized protein (TIGR00369 family)